MFSAGSSLIYKTLGLPIRFFDEHLCSFYFLDIINKACLNIHIYVVVWMYISISLRSSLELELLGAMIKLCLTS